MLILTENYERRPVTMRVNKIQSLTLIKIPARGNESKVRITQAKKKKKKIARRIRRLSNEIKYTYRLIQASEFPRNRIVKFD